MPRPDRARVLLLWSGGLFESGANFGVPQLLGIARALETQADAIVDVVDLDMERGMGGLDLAALASRHYDLVGISCYSSFDYLKVMALGERLRALLPRAWLVTGGYHASARPDDFTGTGSPFDFVVVGDGERSMVRLARALTSGKRPLMRIVGPESVEDPTTLVPYRWELLQRYKGIARKVASQAEIYLSRGCPYDCAFCMERAKRDVSWRPLEPLAAVEEMHRLDSFLDLTTWTVFVADALFGMKRAWRRTFLEELARRPTRAVRTWLLIRIDLIEREDLVLMAKANASPGFGLESGDPAQIRRIRKTGRLEGYLDKMMTIAEWCRDLDVPFGANIIVGHPGETEQSLRTSAAYMRKLFLDPKGTKGFLSVDPFRLYPGSPIDEDREAWERDTGFFAHRYPWWHDGDQEFLSEWVDPSADLDFRRTLSLRSELFDPIVHGIADNFSHHGPARDYFMRSVSQQVALSHPEQKLRTLALFHEWRRFSRRGKSGSRGPTFADDAELGGIAREARLLALRKLGRPLTDPIGRALLEVPRERFVRSEDVGRSARDEPLPLTDDGASSISALHAYETSFRALALSKGDALVDLGGGTGYGVALAAHIVGGSGHVVMIEYVPELAERARTLLSDLPNVLVISGDAHDTSPWRGALKVHCGFFIAGLPGPWAEALVEGGVLVAPVGDARRQVLTVFEKRGGVIVARPVTSVLYVGIDRGPMRLTTRSLQRRRKRETEGGHIMANILHPILGTLDPSSPGFWDATVTFGGRDVSFDLTIDGSDLAAADVNALPQKPDDLVPLDRAARLAILEDAQSGDEDAAAALYITHHHSEFPRDDFERLFGTDKPDLANAQPLLSRLVLVRVGLYPEDDDRRVLLDYSIDPDATNYLLCVSFDASKQPTAVDLES